MDLRRKLLNIQSELKAPKSQYNNFGRYKYRSCEDILEAVKPILHKYNATLNITDKIEMIGDRFYVMATAYLLDTESDECISNTAYAREELEKKGQDGSQITGTASSYARKYCLNGLFLIDDSRDADTVEEATLIPEDMKCTEEQKNEINDLLKSKKCSKKKFEEIQKKYKFNSSADLTRNKAQMVLDAMKGE